MMLAIFGLYVITLSLILADKRTAALISIYIGLVGIALILWFHATSHIGIRL